MVVALHGLLEGKVEVVCSRSVMMNSIERDVFLLAYFNFIYPRLRLVELIDVTARGNRRIPYRHRSHDLLLND